MRIESRASNHAEENFRTSGWTLALDVRCSESRHGEGAWWDSRAALTAPWRPRLLVEQGHEVTAGYMKNWINEENIPGDCPWQQDIEDARAVARTLGIEFRVVDLIDSYRRRIVDYLIEGYRSGSRRIRMCGATAR
jgi:hypothetical protein